MVIIFYNIKIVVYFWSYKYNPWWSQETSKWINPKLWTGSVLYSAAAGDKQAFSVRVTVHFQLWYKS